MKYLLPISIVLAALIVALAAWAYGGRECETIRFHTPGTFNPEGTDHEQTKCKWPWEQP